MTKQQELPANSKKIIKPLLISFYIIVGLFILFHVVFANRIIPGVEISGVGVGGMTYSQALNLLEQKENNSDKQLKISYLDNHYAFGKDDFSVDYSLEVTVLRAFEIGRTGNFFYDTRDKIQGIVNPLSIKPHYDVDEEKLDNVLSVLEGELNKAPENAYYIIEGDKLIIVPSFGGRVLDDQLFTFDVFSGLDNIDFSTKSVVLKDVEPKIDENTLNTYKDEAQEIVFKDITIVYDENSWELTPEQILNLIRIEISAGKTALALNHAALEELSGSIAYELNKLPRGSVLETEGDKVVKFEIVQEGEELNINKFKSDMEDMLLKKGSGDVELGMINVSGSDDPDKYGIVELLGTGESKYTGSASSRIHNLTLAAERTSGVLVPPGETYSFNESVGDISGTTGYQTAYVISNGRTVLGDGGGVCQTSTTLFRAVLNAGLPVVKRNPHAYRVSYYEIESPVGMDASIYQPYVDFQFKNDTKNYILVQAEADLENFGLNFKLYGTPDGREVTISEPVVSKQIAPPETLYQDTEELPKGQVKQIDFAAWGATASFDRLVEKNGETMYEDTFTTRYQPWRAIFLVGTKED